MMSTEQAVQELRRDPRYSQLMHDSYLDEDVLGAAKRFLASAEFREVLTILGGVRGKEILDLGSGRGVAAYAFAKSGAECVYAVEPDNSQDVGRGAIHTIGRGLPISTLDGVGEQLRLEDQSVDVVYGRQIFHHASQLELMVRECARVLRDGGLALICREHIADDERELKRFLDNHPVHALTGQEHAYPLDRYLAALRAADFEVKSAFGPWDSIINAFPAVRSSEELSRYAVTLLDEKLGASGKLIAKLPGMQRLIWARLRRPVPGRIYSFVGKREPRPPA